MDAPPDEVFAVLADARSYGEWVVGSKDVRAADPGFPAPGSRFPHSVGLGPLLALHTLGGDRSTRGARPHRGGRGRPAAAVAAGGAGAPPRVRHGDVRPRAR